MSSKLKGIWVKPPVYRHESDAPNIDCGRACAQMVIASLWLGQQARKPQDGDRVPETQQHLSDRETNPGDGPGKWYTFPDELALLLANSPHLKELGKSTWKVAFHDTKAGKDRALDALFADIVAGLKLNMPSILSVMGSDHWVVVDRAWLERDDRVRAIRIIDPAGSATKIGTDRHTYKDACYKHGHEYWSRPEREELKLAEFDLAVGDFKPLKYKGKYLAIVPVEPGQPAAPQTAKARNDHGSIDLSAFSAQFEKRPDILTELREIAADLELSELDPLLEDSPVPVRRVVQDIEGTDDKYLLASLFNQDKGIGLIGCFDLATNRVSRFLVTEQPELHHALTATPADEPLFYTRRKLTTWSLPYYPYQQTRRGFQRLVDSAPLVYAATSPDAERLTTTSTTIEQTHRVIPRWILWLAAAALAAALIYLYLSPDGGTTGPVPSATTTPTETTRTTRPGK